MRGRQGLGLEYLTVESEMGNAKTFLNSK